MADRLVIKKNFKYRLYPTAAQIVALDGQLVEACLLYNAALQERRDAWRIARKSLGYCDQANQLKEIRANGDLALANYSCCQDVLRRVDKAFNAFFGRIRNGQKPGHPRFRPVSRYDSITFPSYGDGCKMLDNGKLRLQGVGAVLTNSDSPGAYPGDVAFKIAAIAIGKPFKTPVAVKLAAEKLDAYTGVYQADEKTQAIVRRDGEKLFLYRGLRKTEIVPASETDFFMPDSLRDRLTFIKSGAAVSGYVHYEGTASIRNFARPTSRTRRRRRAHSVGAVAPDDFNTDSQTGIKDA